MAIIQADISDELKRQVEAEATRQQRSIQAVVEEALRALLRGRVFDSDEEMDRELSSRWVEMHDQEGRQ